jgi:hypothetical protein
LSIKGTQIPGADLEGENGVDLGWEATLPSSESDMVRRPQYLSHITSILDCKAQLLTNVLINFMGRIRQEETMSDLDLTLGLLPCEILVGPKAAPQTTKVA